MARRVSASMSRRVCSSSSSRLALASSTVSRSCTSPALRARAMISSAWARASRSRVRYSSSRPAASVRARSAVSIDSSIACWRLSSASVMAGHAHLRRTKNATRNASTVQIISPTLGLTRKLEFSSVVVVAASGVTSASICLLAQEEGDEAEDEGVEHDRLGQREAEPLDRGDLVAHLGLTGHRLDDLAEDVADADARADGAEAGADAQGDRLAGLAAVFLRVGRLREVRELGDEGGVHCSWLLLVLLGDGAAEVDRGEGGEDEGLQGGDQADLEEEEGHRHRPGDEAQHHRAEHRQVEEDDESAAHEEDQQVPREDVREESHGERDEPDEVRD